MSRGESFEQSSFHDRGEAEQRPRDFLAELQHAQEKFQEATGKEANPVVRGVLKGLVSGVKPGNTWPKDAEPAHVFSDLPEGDRPVRFHSLVAIPRRIQERLDREQKLAQEIGWHTEQGIEENIGASSHAIVAPPAEQARVGFVLGFPETAIRSWQRRLELEQRGVPTVDELMRSGSDWRVAHRIAIDRLSPRSAGFLKALNVGYQGILRRNDFFRFSRELREAYQEELIDFYEREYQLARADAELMVYEHDVEIKDAEGDIIYGFRAFGKDADHAADIQALRDKVALAFSDESEKLAAK